MKSSWIIILLMVVGSQVNAQTTAEWLRQKATQKKYLLEQIAALKVYTGYLQKGYQIAKGGLTNIGDLTGREFGLHGKYFLSLSTVNPIVKKHPQVKIIVAMQKEIDGMITALLVSVRKSKYLGDEEKQYVKRTIEKVLTDCERILEELLTVIKDGNAELKDEERLKWIGRLHGDMESNVVFIRKFSTDAQAIHQERQRQQREIETGKVLNGIK